MDIQGTIVCVGICGGSASGKTTFARKVSAQLEDLDPLILKQDTYFRDWSVLPEEDREALRTANHPRAVCWEGLVGHVEQLLAGQPACFPVPGTRGWQRGERRREVPPSRVLIVEGHLVFWHEPLRRHMQVKIYIEADPHERVLRRMLRDTKGGRRSLEDAVAWYRHDVMPNYPTYTEPTREYADLIVPFDGGGDTAAKLVATGIRGLAGGDSPAPEA